MTARLNAKYVVFTLIAMMMGYVLYHNERFLIEPANPIWQHYGPFKWWLLPHGIFGAIVILFAPLQFSDRLRRRYTKTHRVMGRLYVAGAFFLAPLGAYIQYYEERLGLPRSFTVLAVVNAVMLIVATNLAFLFAYKRRITQHRQWVVRSYAIALALPCQSSWATLQTIGGRSAPLCPHLPGQKRRRNRFCLMELSRQPRSSVSGLKY